MFETLYLKNMYIFCAFLCFVALTAANSCQSVRYQGPSGYHYDEKIDGWLKLHRIPATWDEAHSRCLKEGAQLASPINSKLLKAMQSIMKSNKLPCGVITGIHDKNSPGHFSSIEGAPLEEIPLAWKTSSQCPDKSDNWILLLPDGTLDIGSKSLQYPYICYKRRTNETETSQDSTADLGYVKDDRTGSYYKFHREGKTWPEAADICTEEDAHLVVINSDVEALVLKELFTKHPEEVLQSKFKNSALIGMRDWGQERGWLTFRGQTLDEAGYSVWSPGQPDHSGHPDGHQNQDPYCGAIFRSAQLDDIWCDVKFAFICERSFFKSEDCEKEIVFW